MKNRKQRVLELEQERLRRERDNQHQGLLRLPAELRSYVYDLIFTVEDKDVEHIKSNKNTYLRRSFLNRSLAYICRQIRYETLPMYVDRNIFVFPLQPEFQNPTLLSLLPDYAIVNLRRFEVRTSFTCKGFLERQPQHQGFAIVAVDRSKGSVDANLWARRPSCCRYATIPEQCRYAELHRAASLQGLPEVEANRPCCRSTRDELAAKLAKKIKELGLQEYHAKIERKDFKTLRRWMMWHTIL